MGNFLNQNSNEFFTHYLYIIIILQYQRVFGELLDTALGLWETDLADDCNFDTVTTEQIEFMIEINRCIDDSDVSSDDLN
jgi:hypothetical protein